jgi:cytochrome P450
MTTSITTAAYVPAHVPQELFWEHDIDVFPAQFGDPYVGTCDSLHAGPHIVWAAKGAYCGRPGWMLTRFEHFQQVQMDPDRFAASLSRDASSLLGFDLPLLPFESDPPQHKTYRQLIQPWFQPSAVNALEPMLRDICAQLIGKFEDRGSCEFVSEFSSLFPSYVFLGLMGLPRDMLPQFLAWENAFLRGDSVETRAGAMRAIYDYFRELLKERRARPQDNLMSLIANGETDGRRLTDDEAIGMCITLYIGGLDSVASGLGWYMRHLALDRDLQQRLRNDPGLIRLAVDELSRAYGTNSTIRTVTRDTEFHGVPMCEGDIVAMPTFLCARDPHAFADPHVVDINRNARSMSFGTGPHNCVGIHLAKREAMLVISEFLSRFENIRIPDGEQVSWTTQTIWGVKRLPLGWG